MQMVAKRKLQQLQYQTKETQDKNITGGKERHFIMIKDKVHQEVQTIKNVYALIMEVKTYEVKSDRTAIMNRKLQTYSWRFQIPLSQ